MFQMPKEDVAVLDAYQCEVSCVICSGKHVAFVYDKVTGQVYIKAQGSDKADAVHNAILLIPKTKKPKTRGQILVEQAMTTGDKAKDAEIARLQAQIDALQQQVDTRTQANIDAMKAQSELDAPPKVDGADGTLLPSDQQVDPPVSRRRARVSS